MTDSPDLSHEARRIITDEDNRIFVSAASLWEVAIKRRKGRLVGVDDYLNHYASRHQAWGFFTIPIEPSDVVAAGDLALPHEDPFDRVLIVQSRRLAVPLVTCDKTMHRFATDCVW